VEPMSNCSSASGGARLAVAATFMQAIESETLILYHTDLRGEWPETAARAFARRLAYARRVAAGADRDSARASLAGVALALAALTRLLGRAVQPRELAFARGEKPRLVLGAGLDGDGTGPDFSISHSGPWVGCAAVAHGDVGFDLELGTDALRTHWVVREALLKAAGVGLRALGETRTVVPEGAGECRLRWRGAWWHLERLELFAGAAACAVSSRPLRGIETHPVALAELFAA
jgi:hypothetical protein